VTSLQDPSSVINQNPKRPREEGWRGCEREGVWCKITPAGKGWGAAAGSAGAVVGLSSDLVSPANEWVYRPAA
jgi:hypothetical protein